MNEFTVNTTGPEKPQEVRGLDAMMVIWEEHQRRARAIEQSVERAADVITEAQAHGKGVFLTIHATGTISAFATSAIEARTMLVHREEGPPPQGGLPTPVRVSPPPAPPTHYPTGLPLSRGGLVPPLPGGPVPQPYGDPSAVMMATMIASAL